ncbi:MAG: hypothetical protein LC769_10890 [Chloroflexi bacterium]|nr:hypothetical protein [Chloroflexota bacterium]
MQDLADLPLDVAEHVLAVFVARRGTDPESGETMKRVGGPLRKLHADLSGGRSIRAVTWYDRGRDVCWLLAAGEHDVYNRIEELATTDSHLPTQADVANFEADAPIRLIERIVRNARPALERAISTPGIEVPVTEKPLPKAYFRVYGDHLWVRVIMFESGQRQLTDKQLAAIWAGVFGHATMTITYPNEGGQWDSMYMVGPCPTLDSWPPPASLI